VPIDIPGIARCSEAAADGLHVPGITAFLSSGFPELDAMLGGGWPIGGLTELLIEVGASAELGLLSPALTRLSCGDATADPAWVMLIAPPWIPYAPGLCWQGLAPSRVLVTDVRQAADVLWAMEAALGSGSCAGIIAWAGVASRVALQRLHLLAGKRPVWSVLVRAARFRYERSPAMLRIQLQLQPGAQTTVRVEIFKNRLRAAGTVTVALP
jgi:hypothetical protein